MLYRKWKIKNFVLDTHLEAFWIKQGLLFLHISVLGACRGMHVQLHASYAEACFSLRFCFLFEIVVTVQNVLSSISIVCRKIWNELFISLLPIARLLLQSILSSAIWIFFEIFSCIFSSEDLVSSWFIRNFTRNENVLRKMIRNRGYYVSSWNTFGDIIVESIIN